MRQFLLATVCSIGAAALAGGALAADGADLPNPIQGQMVMKPGATPGANNNNNAYGTARKGPSANPTPGTLVIHFNSRVLVEWAQGWNSLMNLAPGTARTSNQMGSYIRLYGGADGMAANGLRYGGAFEVRTNFRTPNLAAAGATGGINSTSSTPSISSPASNASASTSVQTLYVRRAFVYAGTDKLGIIRLGQGDDLISLFDQGRTTMQTYSPTSNFNGSNLSGAIGGNSAPAYVFISGSGDNYDTQKIVYLSPNFSGFDFGLMYSPSAFNSFSGCGVASTACSNLTTSLIPADGQRFTNLVAGGVRYNGDIGPVNVHWYGAYYTSGHVNFNGTAAAARVAVGAPAGSTWNGQFDNLNFGSTGIALTYQGFTFGANFIGGAVNGRMATRPSGGAGTAAWLVGAQYRVPGMPLTIGTAFATIDSQGAVAMTTLSQRHEYEFDIGWSYRLAPGMVIFGDYLYQHRYQGGFDFATNRPGSAHNSVQGQGFNFGTMMTW